ncbi:hypothetical protein SteCoe_15238 [Stentor coeruleus]|uniref:Uncharacterized protein n=1 Tax=Stentor coeruleus TaxID=5963 RepID=A0A1R2C457_9CILI|nr:hypothetical protein SteCoe_15238 [Stentor coeruleus]
MDKNHDIINSPITGSPDSSIHFKRLSEKIVPEVIPKWDDSEDGQKLHIPQSDNEVIIAKVQLCRILCCYAPFGTGNFLVDWKEKTHIASLISKDQVELFCAKASDYCKQSMDHAAAGRKVFYFSMVIIFLICVTIIGLGLKFKVPWISGIAVLLFVFGIGCFYEIINSRARRIHETLKGFIELNDEYTRKGIEIKPGPYGAYIEFAIKSNKSA